MTEIFSYSSTDLNESPRKITICSGSIILSSEWRILVHISSSTQKYQFIWWRLDDTTSLRKNAVNRAEEVLWHKNMILSDEDLLCVTWKVDRDWVSEDLILFHYRAKLEDEADIWAAEWKTLEQLEELWGKNMLSSKNVLIASKYFLER